MANTNSQTWAQINATFGICKSTQNLIFYSFLKRRERKTIKQSLQSHFKAYNNESPLPKSPVGGWMDGGESRFKDCLQQSKTTLIDCKMVYNP